MSEELRKLFYEVVPEARNAEITPETRLVEDLGLNSLHFMLLAMALEDTFQVSVSGDAAFQTVGDVCAFLEKTEAA